MQPATQANSQPPVVRGVGNEYRPRSSGSKFLLSGCEGLALHRPCVTDYVLGPIYTYGPNGIRDGDEHTAYAPVGVICSYRLFPFSDEAPFLNSAMKLPVVLFQRKKTPTAVFLTYLIP